MTTIVFHVSCIVRGFVQFICISKEYIFSDKLFYRKCFSKYFPAKRNSVDFQAEKLSDMKLNESLCCAWKEYESKWTQLIFLGIRRSDNCLGQSSQSSVTCPSYFDYKNRIHYLPNNFVKDVSMTHKSQTFMCICAGVFVFRIRVEQWLGKDCMHLAEILIRMICHFER